VCTGAAWKVNVVCTSGFLMTAYSLLNNSEKPTEEKIRKGIEGNLCRCTGYVNIVRSIEAAAEEKGSGNWW
jgi:carbon-monoxide dehydrogenase small subunit